MGQNVFCDACSDWIYVILQSLLFILYHPTHQAQAPHSSIYGVSVIQKVNKKWVCAVSEIVVVMTFCIELQFVLIVDSDNLNIFADVNVCHIIALIVAYP